ncbi:MAG: hypothetical protein KF693_07985 [Nitrospira sp.]|nr:hypothetical protein [Nitrospira sp.]
MTNRPNPVRRYSRFPVRWPMLYGSDELVAEGTVLDLTSLGWRLAGSMPVVPGMQLTLQVSIPERSTPLRIQRATVLWVKDHEFAIEAHEMAPIDHTWVDEFLRQKLGLIWMSRTADHEISVHPRDEMTHSATVLPEFPVPSVEDLQRELSALHTDSTDMSADAHGTGNSDFQEGERHSPFIRLPETIFPEARRIIRRMLALKAARARTGRDPIANN